MTPAREERTPERARELADLLTWQLDHGHGGRDGSLQSALYAWREEHTYSASEAEWEVIGFLAGTANYEQPESAKKAYAAGVQVLANLQRAMLSHLNSGQDFDVLWEPAHIWMVKLREAQADLNAALAELKQDAVRLVSA